MSTEAGGETTTKSPTMDSQKFGEVWVAGIKANKTFKEIVDDLTKVFPDSLNGSEDKKSVTRVRQKSTQLRKAVEESSMVDGKPTKTLPKIQNFAPRGGKKVDYSQFAVEIPAESNE